MEPVPAPRRPASPAPSGRPAARPGARAASSQAASSPSRAGATAARGASAAGRDVPAASPAKPAASAPTSPGPPTPAGGGARVGSPPPSAASRPASSRPASRPSGRGSGRAAAPTQHVQTRLPRLFTVRVMVFGCVVLLAFILVSPTLHSFVQQRQQLAQLRAQVAAAQARNDDLQADLDRWQDPAYVQAQARQRLSFVMPGEKAFRVVDPQTVPDVEPAEKSGPSSALDDAGTGPWYQAVWASVEAAGAQPVTTATDQDATPSTPATPGSTDGSSTGSTPRATTAP